jgi:hypothetical protein
MGTGSGRCNRSIVVPLAWPVPVPIFAQAGPTPAPDQAAIRRQLSEILSRPEFSNKRQKSLLLQLLEWLSDLVGWLGALRSSNPALYWTLVVGCSCLLLLLAGHIIWTLRRVFFRGGHLPAQAEMEEKRRRLSQAFWDEAGSKAAGGDYTEAIRCLFLSLVYRFDESGRVLLQNSLTNREYLALFRDRPELQDELKVFVDTLDENWYGQHPTARQQFESCLALYQHVSKAMH